MRRTAIALSAIALVTTACSSSAKSGSGSNTSGSTQTTVEANSSDPAINQWAIQYTGGKAQQATGSPINIGYVNNDSLFPEATIGVNAAAAYANAELNGADGHVIKIVECAASNAADGASCGAKMANDNSINLVLTGTLLEGNTELYNALNKKKAVILGNGVTPADFTTTAGEAFVAGAPGVLSGMAKFTVDQFHPKTVAILANDNDAGRAGVSLIMKPIFDAAHVTVKDAYVANEASGNDVQSAMQNVGADKADVFVSILTLQSCIGMYDAIQALGVHPTVVTTGLCFGTPMTEHLKSVGASGDYPDGWYFGGYGYSYYLPPTTPHMADSGMNTYIAKVHQYGKAQEGKPLEYSGFAGPMFANVLTAVKFINEIGADKLTVANLDSKIRGFKGPMMLQVGPINCGGVKLNGVTYPAVCALQMGIQQYKGGQWVSIADGHNGKPIDVNTGS